MKNRSICTLLLIFLVILTVLFASSLTCVAKTDDYGSIMTTENTWQGDGYESPQEVIRAYVRYWSDRDIKGMVSVFAIETYVDSFNGMIYLQYENALRPDDFDRIQHLAGNDFARESNILRRIGDVNRIIQHHQLIAQWNPEWDNYSEELNLNSFLTRPHFFLSGYEPYIYTIVNSVMNSSSFSVLYDKDISFKYIQLVLQQDADVKQVIDTYTQLVGGEELAITSCTLDINGKRHYLIMDCVKYNGKWYALSCGENGAKIMLFQDAFCGLVPANDDVFVEYPDLAEYFQQST